MGLDAKVTLVTPALSVVGESGGRAVDSRMAMTEREKYLKYHDTPLAKKRRAERNAARRAAEKKYGKKALRGKDVDHINTNPGGKLSNAASNVRIISSHRNRARTANLWREIDKRNH